MMRLLVPDLALFVLLTCEAQVAFSNPFTERHPRIKIDNIWLTSDQLASLEEEKVEEVEAFGRETIGTCLIHFLNKIHREISSGN